jgi:hypothetical protein
MLWSQYKSATIGQSEYLRKQITGIPNTAHRNSKFLTLQTSEYQKKSDRNLWNQKQNQNFAYNGSPKNWNQKSEFLTMYNGKLSICTADINTQRPSRLNFEREIN